MKQIVVSVFDTAVNAFGRPFFVPTTAVALRSFTDEVNRKEPANQMYQHPADYHLYQLGHFDEEAGEFVNEKQMLVRAQDLRKE